MSASPRPVLPRQAIILAAGEGRRLAPITDTLPKPLVPFFGRPLIDWALDKVLTAGVTRVAINAFHLADRLEAHVAELARRLASSHPEVELHLSHEPALLGTGGAVRYLRHWLTPGESFWVLNADAVFAEPLATLAPPAPALLATHEPTFAHERRLLATPDGHLAGLDPSSPPGAFTFCGVTLADAGLPERLPDGASCILRQGFLPYLGGSTPSAQLRVRLVETTAFFADTGTPELLVDAHWRGQVMTTSGPPCADLTSRGTSPESR